MTSSGNPVRGGMLGWLLSDVKNRAPVTGITLSTRVGRLSETHSDIGIQLHSNSQVNWRWNGKVAESVKRYCFNNVCKCTRRNGHSALLQVSCMSAVGKWVWG